LVALLIAERFWCSDVGAGRRQAGADVQTVETHRDGEGMLRNVTDLQGYAIRATDGVIGRVDDAYFDDEDWAIRYLIVDAGGWLSGRRVLISPIAVGHPD
jgi:PRC-barrel domain